MRKSLLEHFSEGKSKDLFNIHVPKDFNHFEHLIEKGNDKEL